MIVVDASVVIELLTSSGRSAALHNRLAADSLAAPDILPIEVASGLRGLNRGGLITDDRLDAAASDLLRLPVRLAESLPLVPNVLGLRHNISAYDAAYVTLAMLSGCPLLTLDRRLARAAELHCTVEVPTH